MTSKKTQGLPGKYMTHTVVLRHRLKSSFQKLIACLYIVIHVAFVWKSSHSVPNTPRKSSNIHTHVM